MDLFLVEKTLFLHFGFFFGFFWFLFWGANPKEEARARAPRFGAFEAFRVCVALTRNKGRDHTHAEREKRERATEFVTLSSLARKHS